jgi:hypothetical protein
MPRLARGFVLFVLALVFLLRATPPTQAANPNERLVEPQVNVQDAYTVKGKLYVLHFKFRPPRFIKVNIPGKGQRVCLYLWYQVFNIPAKGQPGEPRTFIPQFELVTQDKKTVPARDKILPTVEEAIRRIEDPTGYYKIKNSVTISSEPIPPTLPDSVPQAVTGVAIWDDFDLDSNYFSIFVAGLSNGWALTDPIPPDTKQIVRRKTLRLNFKRPGDRFQPKSSEIRFVGPAEWLYRGSSISVPALPE